MKIELRYFTGTGNSLRVINTFRDVFAAGNHSVRVASVIHEKKIPESDLIGFCFPVYAFGIPRIARRYLHHLPSFKVRQKAFVIINGGDDDEAGKSVMESKKILMQKNCEIVYSGVVKMPANWTTSPLPPFPPPMDEALEIIRQGVARAEEMAADILNGVVRHHVFNIPKRYNVFRFYKDYWLFKYMGIQNLWRTYKVYDSCNGCGICARACPTESIKIIGKLPVWSSTCEQCMRCVNICPQEAVYQTMGGDTKGKHKYMEPHFKPLKEAQ